MPTISPNEKDSIFYYTHLPIVYHVMLDLESGLQRVGRNTSIEQDARFPLVAAVLDSVSAPNISRTVAMAAKGT